MRQRETNEGKQQETWPQDGVVSQSSFERKLHTNTSQVQEQQALQMQCEWIHDAMDAGLHTDGGWRQW